jgi:hypothetical protein
VTRRLVEMERKMNEEGGEEGGEGEEGETSF